MKKYRIFLVIGGKMNPHDESHLWLRNLYDPLVELGHDVFLLDIDKYATDNHLGHMSVEAKEQLSNELPTIFLKEHQAKKFDIFFSYLHHGQIEPSVLKEISKHIYTINYSTNYHQFEMYKEIVQNVHKNIYISKIAKEGFDNLGVDSYWMPIAATPTTYKPATTKNNHSVFVGSCYGHRTYLFWRLLQYGIDLHVYGNDWCAVEPPPPIPLPPPIPKNPSLKWKINQFFLSTIGYEFKKPTVNVVVQDLTPLEDKVQDAYHYLNRQILNDIQQNFSQRIHASLSGEDYVKVLGEAGIVVNIQESRFNHDYNNHRVLFGSNLRDYETTMCGSFLCTQYSEEISNLFEIDKEIVCYHNEHDLADKIKYFTKNQMQRDRIAMAGHKKALQEHTWHKRLEKFFSTITL
jgi:hypothetical protein